MQPSTALRTRLAVPKSAWKPYAKNQETAAASASGQSKLLKLLDPVLWTPSDGPR